MLRVARGRHPVPAGSVSGLPRLPPGPSGPARIAEELNRSQPSQAYGCRDAPAESTHVRGNDTNGFACEIPTHSVDVGHDTGSNTVGPRPVTSWIVQCRAPSVVLTRADDLFSLSNPKAQQRSSVEHHGWSRKVKRVWGMST